MSRITTNRTSALEFSQGKSDEVERLLSSGRQQGLFRPAESHTQLMDEYYAEFCERVKENDGWCCIMYSLYVAVQKDNFHMTLIITECFNTWLARCPPPVAALSQAAPEGNNVGGDGWRSMMAALVIAAQNNFSGLSKISESYNGLLSKCPDALPKLIAELPTDPEDANVLERFSVHADPVTKELLNRLKIPSHVLQDGEAAAAAAAPPRVAMR